MALLLQIAGAVLAGLVATVWLVMLWAGQLSRPKRAPPGSFGLPLIGETLQFIRDHKSLTPHIYAENRRAKYGDVFTTHHMTYPTVMSVDPEVNKFILQNEGKYFLGHYPRSLRILFGEGAILRVYGEFHKRLHRIVLSFVNTTKLKDCVMADVEMLIKRAMANWEGRTVYVENEAKALAFNIIVNYLIGVKPGEKTAYLMEEYLKLIKGVICIPIRIPGTLHARSMKAKEKVVKLLQKIIDERRRHPDSEQTDILAVMMAERDENGQPAFSDTVICNNMVNFMGAGEETTPMAIMLSVKYLHDCPKALHQLREEHLNIRKTKQPGENLTWSDYTSMTFTNMVINETLRLSNPASGVLRIATQDVEVKGHFIPKGWLVFPFFRCVHLDETVYPDPLTFNPWRWEKKIPNIYFTPFGGGGRVCVGQELARLEMALFLHYLVTQFTWEVHDDQLINYPAVTFKNNLPITVKALHHL